MKRYKLTTKDVTTHKGYKWEVGVEQVITTPGNKLCSPEVFHFYDSPEIALLMNPAHANIENPVVWEVKCDEVAHDGTKGGAKRMTLVKRVPAPKFTRNQRTAFAIKTALAVYKNKAFVTWANDWLSGIDRSKGAAYAANAANAAANLRKAIKAAAVFAVKFEK